MVLEGEFGGLGLKVDGHTWENKTWGYQNVSDSAELTSGYEALWQDAWELHKADGLSAAVYTQLTDVETETNGLLTYDRALVKLDADSGRQRRAGPAFAEQKPILASSERSPQTWRYTTEQPADAWNTDSVRRRGLAEAGPAVSAAREHARAPSSARPGPRSDIWLRPRVRCQGCQKAPLRQLSACGCITTKMPKSIFNGQTHDRRAKRL